MGWNPTNPRNTAKRNGTQLQQPSCAGNAYRNYPMLLSTQVTWPQKLLVLALAQGEPGSLRDWPRQLCRSSASALPSPPPRLQTDPQGPSPHLGGRGGWETQAGTPASEPTATRAATPRAGPGRRTPARPTAARRADSPTAVPAQPTREGRRGAHGRPGMRAARGARGKLRAGETRRAAPKPALDAGPRRLPGGASPLSAKKVQMV